MGECPFCQMIEKKIKAKIEYEDKDILVIHDIHPQAPVHLLFIPKSHIARIGEMKASDTSMIGNLILRAKEIAAAKGWNDYRLVFNNGPEAGQSVYHIHLHLLSGRRMHWPPG